MHQLHKGIKVVLELLVEKKHFLNEFNKINLQGLSQFQNNNFDNIEVFYNSREKLLEIIQYIDQKIDKLPSDKLNGPSNASRKETSFSSAAPAVNTTTANSDDSKMIAFIQLEIKALAQEILKQDMQILSLMDQEKSSIIKDLQNIGKNKKHFSSYKTKINPKMAVDEEA